MATVSSAATCGTALSSILYCFFVLFHHFEPGHSWMSLLMVGCAHIATVRRWGEQLAPALRTTSPEVVRWPSSQAGVGYFSVYIEVGVVEWRKVHSCSEWSYGVTTPSSGRCWCEREEIGEVGAAVRGTTAVR